MFLLCRLSVNAEGDVLYGCKAMEIFLLTIFSLRHSRPAILVEFTLLNVADSPTSCGRFVGKRITEYPRIRKKETFFLAPPLLIPLVRVAAREEEDLKHARK